MPKPKLKIAKTGFFEVEGVESAKDFFDVIRTRYDLEISKEPDLLFCAVGGGHEHLNYDCIKFYIIEEPPGSFDSHSIWDYALSGRPTDSKNFHGFAFFYTKYFCDWREGKSDYIKSLKNHPKDRFCNFFQRIGTEFYTTYEGLILREDFCKKLMQYKHVDCPGIVMNNMKNPDDPKLTRDENKLKFLKHYRFTICFENYSHVHFMAEKIAQTLIAGSIPIYWGNINIAEYFNPNCMINCHNYTNMNAVLKHVIEIDNNPKLYKQYTKAPAILPESKLHNMNVDSFMDRFDYIASRIGKDKPFSQTYHGRSERIQKLDEITIKTEIDKLKNEYNNRSR